MKKYIALIVLFLTMLPAFASAQKTINIQGVVTDSNNETQIGVNIYPAKRPVAWNRYRYRRQIYHSGQTWHNARFFLYRIQNTRDQNRHGQGTNNQCGIGC